MRNCPRGFCTSPYLGSMLFARLRPRPRHSAFMSDSFGAPARLVLVFFLRLGGISRKEPAGVGRHAPKSSSVRWNDHPRAVRSFRGYSSDREIRDKDVCRGG